MFPVAREPVLSTSAAARQFQYQHQGSATGNGEVQPNTSRPSTSINSTQPPTEWAFMHIPCNVARHPVIGESCHCAPYATWASGIAQKDSALCRIRTSTSPTSTPWNSPTVKYRNYKEQSSSSLPPYKPLRWPQVLPSAEPETGLPNLRPTVVASIFPANQHNAPM